jgi:hypothetical protein
MKSIFWFFLSVLAFVLSSCSEPVRLRPLMSRTLDLKPSDFGPAELSKPLLGSIDSDSGLVVVHYGLPEKHLRSRYSQPNVAFVSVVHGIKFLNRLVKSLPHDGEHASILQQLIRTRSRMMDFYNHRRIAFNSVPPFTGRTFMARNAIMPALGTTR